MSIAVKCGNCQAAFKAKDEHAGRRGKCPKCQQPIVVPTPEDDLPTLPAIEMDVAPASDDLPILPAIEIEPAPVRRAPAAAAAPPSRKPVPNRPIVAEVVDGLISATTSPAPRRAAATAPAAPKPSLAQLHPQIIGAFKGYVPPVDVPFTYRLAAGLVALVMVLLPLIYVALIGLVVYVVYLHAVYDIAMLQGSGSGRAKGMALLIYLTPLLAGPLLILFMIKPLFAKASNQRPPRTLQPQQEPLLFAFVERVCAVVGAPRPKKINVDCEVNASASFRKGFLSIFLSGDLVLTIGLPLVAGLNLRQFAGVLAHEFGHFSQGAGMRLTYIVRSINHWFVRVVYERDEWDERLERWARSAESRIGLMLQFVRLLVWLTRRVLWVLMVIGNAVSGYLLRQMEFHADRYEARLAGSHTFAETARRLPVLGFASRNAFADLNDFFRDGRLGDNLPKLVMANVDQFTPEVLKEIEKFDAESKTGWFDTHPANPERIANAAAENSVGVFQLELPATVLFADFDALARQSTWDLYVEQFDGKVDALQVHSVDDLMARQARDTAGNKALGRFFQGAFNVLRTLPVPPRLPDIDPTTAVARLRTARQQMLAAKPDYEAAFKAYDEADTHMLEAGQATALLQAKLKIGHDTFSRPLVSVRAANDCRESAGRRQVAMVDQLRPFEEAAAERIVSALRLLRVPAVQQKIDDAELCCWEAERFLPAMATMNRLQDDAIELRNARAAMAILLGNYEGNEENADLGQAIRSAADAVLQSMERLYRKLQQETYPFDHAKGNITLARFLFDELPSAPDIGGIWGASEVMLNQLVGLLVRLSGRMAHLSELVETAIGLPLLPEPPTVSPSAT
jgi:Zn-dependent protease with chaperone function